MIKLWTINRWLRWSGFRVVINTWDGEGERTPTLIGVVWVGLYGFRGWKAMRPKREVL